MRIDVLTLFPEVCEPFFSASILGRARQAGHVSIACHNIRDYSKDPHQKVDDRPYGGGPGMVMTCPPIFDAVEAVEKLDRRDATRILLTPQGERLDQRLAKELSRRDRLLLIAGHYEGFDERIRLGLSPLELSIGDYVLSGGEAAALVLVDAVVRLLPGVLGDAESTTEESFSLSESGSPIRESDVETAGGACCLEYPQYTRPREFRGLEVPAVLINGDHGKIEAWRRAQAMERTKKRRPDLLSE
ncbi:MAG: tRNA (guanosine(37)-N1)-methyltransferase TrmD [Phycisphaerales bacterium]|nr:tRNA (guanosine(37)-N1)-methyltransferase TrmD [Phycisphaerales bacterium]